MSDTPQVINTLRTKASEIEGHIAKLEKSLTEARIALAHVNASIRLFEAPEGPTEFPVLYNINRLFKPREVGQLCFEALKEGPKDTRELALYVVRAKGFDENDKYLRSSVAYRIVQALRMQEKRRGPIERAGKEGNAVVWKLACSASFRIV